MWARIRLRTSWLDLASGALGCLLPGDPEKLTRKVESYWSDAGDTIATYSVRSGFLLLMQALEPQPEDEVIFSALNVKGMIKIAKRAGVTPVPLDLDVAHLGPSVESLERAITPKSRVLVVAHLLGARLDLDPLFDCARRHGLVIVEDCAQAFDGRSYAGHPKADLSMFSFGPLKTATALGGGLIRVRDPELREKMRAIHASYRRQTNRSQLTRIVKFVGLKVATSRPGMSLLQRIADSRGRDFGSDLADRARDVAVLKAGGKLEFRPSKGMLRMLSRRIYRFEEGSLEEYAKKGRLLRDLIGDAVVLPGQANRVHNYWVFPLLVDQPREFIDGLKVEGFDASNLPRSQTVAAPEGREKLEPKIAAQALADLIVVPCYPCMSDRELEREAQVIKDIAGRTGSERTRAYARTPGEAAPV